MDRQECPDCWAERTHYDPFPEDCYVAPCIHHVLESGYCWSCGGPLNNDLKCPPCELGNLMAAADDARKGLS